MSDKIRELKLVVLDFIYDVGIAISEWSADRTHRLEIEDKTPKP